MKYISILLLIQHCQLITEHPDISNNKEILLPFIFCSYKNLNFHLFFHLCVSLVSLGFHDEIPDWMA